MNDRPSLVDALNDWLIRHQRWTAHRIELREVMTASAKYDDLETDPRDAPDAAQRLAGVLEAAKHARLRSVKTKDLQIALMSLVDEPLVREPRLSTAVVEEAKSRTTRKATNALFRCLLATFAEASALTNDLHSHLAGCKDRLGARYRRFCANSDFFGPGHGLDVLAGTLLDSANFNTTLLTVGMSRTMQATRYGRALQSNTLRKAVELADANPDYLRMVLSWLRSAGQLGAGQSEFYEILLTPFFESQPTDTTKRIISQFLIGGFRDPRIVGWPNLPSDPGGQRRQRCLATIKKWLALESLELFIQIIDSTAVERMWEARKAFWLPYFERGVVSDVTLILASDAGQASREESSCRHRT